MTMFCNVTNMPQEVKELLSSVETITITHTDTDEKTLIGTGTDGVKFEGVAISDFYLTSMRIVKISGYLSPHRPLIYWQDDNYYNSVILDILNGSGKL